MRRRILHVIATLTRGGAEKQLFLLAAGLPRDEFDVHVCALTRGGPLEEDLRASGIPVTVIGKQWKYDPLAWWQLRRHIAKLKPDLVQTWMFTANAYGRTAARSAGIRHVIASELCVDVWKSWHHLAIDRRLARSCDAVVANSAGVAEFYRQQGIPARLLRVIESGIDPALGSSVTHDQLCDELSIPHGSHLIGAVGRLWHQKRVKDLIWATDLIKVIRDDVHLLIIGDGPQRENLERFRDACLIEDKVHFLGQRDDVMRMMPQFDLLWLASSFEGLPNVILEAMSVGTPVVATDISGNRDLVTHGQSGFLAPVGDRASLARFANKIIEDSALRQRLGEAGRLRVLAEFSAQSMIDKYAALYREILNSKAAGPV